MLKRRSKHGVGAGRALVATMALLALVLIGAFAVPVSGMPAASRSSETDRAAALRQKVLATVEQRTGDKRTRERMRGKIDLLEGRQLRLAAELCDRMTGDEGSAGADIAFSLVTALIVLS